MRPAPVARGAEIWVELEVRRDGPLVIARKRQRLSHRTHKCGVLAAKTVETH